MVAMMHLIILVMVMIDLVILRLGMIVLGILMVAIMDLGAGSLTPSIPSSDSPALLTPTALELTDQSSPLS